MEAYLGLENENTVYTPQKWKRWETLKHSSSISRGCCDTQIQITLSDLFLKPVQEKWHQEIEFFALYFNSSLSRNHQIRKGDHHETNTQPDTYERGIFCSFVDWYCGLVITGCVLLEYRTENSHSSKCKLTNQDIKPGLLENKKENVMLIFKNIDHFSTHFTVICKILHFILYNIYTAATKIVVWAIPN